MGQRPPQPILSLCTSSCSSSVAMPPLPPPLLALPRRTRTLPWLQSPPGRRVCMAAAASSPSVGSPPARITRPVTTMPCLSRGLLYWWRMHMEAVAPPLPRPTSVSHRHYCALPPSLDFPVPGAIAPARILPLDQFSGHCWRQTSLGIAPSTPPAHLDLWVSKLGL